MEAITKKYLDLYAALSGELQERPQLLNHYREAAYDAFARLGVPRFKSEDYQRTDLPSLFAEDWKLHVLDGAPYWASQAFAPEIFIGAFSDFVRLHPELAQEYYGRIAPIATDGLVALNTLFAAEALVIYVPRGAKIPGHIELSYILPRLAGHISVERALIILEDDAEATLHFRDCPETTERAMALRTFASADSSRSMSEKRARRPTWTSMVRSAIARSVGCRIASSTSAVSRCAMV